MTAESPSYQLDWTHKTLPSSLPQDAYMLCGSENSRRGFGRFCWSCRGPLVSSHNLVVRPSKAVGSNDISLFFLCWFTTVVDLFWTTTTGWIPVAASLDVLWILIDSFSMVGSCAGKNRRLGAKRYYTMCLSWYTYAVCPEPLSSLLFELGFLVFFLDVLVMLVPLICGLCHFACQQKENLGDEVASCPKSGWPTCTVTPRVQGTRPVREVVCLDLQKKNKARWDWLWVFNMFSETEPPITAHKSQT